MATHREILSRNSVYRVSRIPPGNLKLLASQLYSESSSASQFHQFDSVVLLWHPDLSVCGKKVKYFMASHCLGCLCNSPDRMIVLKQECLQFKIQRPEICCRGPQVPLAIRTMLGCAVILIQLLNQKLMLFENIYWDPSQF